LILLHVEERSRTDGRTLRSPWVGFSKNTSRHEKSTMKILWYVVTVFILSTNTTTLPYSAAAFIQGGSSIRNGNVPGWGLKSSTARRREQRRLFFIRGRDAFLSPQSQLSLPSSLSSPESEQSRPTAASSNDDDELDDELKANLFQFLLRDLQVEGVPLLAVDSNQVETLQAAVWTTMAELMENNDMQQKVCLVFEEIPMDALRALADEFMVFKTQRRQGMPELERVSLSLLGKGKVGPAMILEVANATQTSSTIANHSNNSNNKNLDEIKYTAAMKAFSCRLLDQTDVYPYKQRTQIDHETTSSQQFNNTAYRFCSSTDVSHIMSSFWNCICELTANPDIATTVLVLPGLFWSQDDHDASRSGKNGGVGQASPSRFVATTQLMSRSLCLFRGNDVYELLYFSPTYNRDEIQPVDEFAHGHLPPRSWIQSILRHHANDNNNNNHINEIINEDDQEELEQVLWDYQRRSPVPAVVIKRVALFQDTPPDNDSTSSTSSCCRVDLELPGGKVQQVMVNDVSAYARNALYLSREGKDALQTALELEMSICK
jgi:hypothetical protein